MQAIEKQVFLRRGAKLPEELRFRGSAIDTDWLALSEDATVLDKRAREVDWHFFQLAEDGKGWALAMNKEVGNQSRSSHCPQTDRILAECSRGSQRS